MSLKERTYSILIVSATDVSPLPLPACFLKPDILLLMLFQVSMPPDVRLQKRRMIYYH